MRRCFEQEPPAPDPSTWLCLVLGKGLPFALVASGGSQPVFGEYAARLDSAHLGLGGLRVRGVEGRADV